MAGAESGMSGAGIPLQPQPQAPAAAAGPADESSDSEGEHEGPQKLIRKVSTSGQIRSKVRGAGAGQPRRLHGRFLYPHPQAGLTRAGGGRCIPPASPGAAAGSWGGEVCETTVPLPSFPLPSSPSSCCVHICPRLAGRAPRGCGAPLGRRGSCLPRRPPCPAGRPGCGGSGWLPPSLPLSFPPAPLPRRRAPLPRGSRPATLRRGWAGSASPSSPLSIPAAHSF